LLEDARAFEALEQMAQLEQERAIPDAAEFARLKRQAQGEVGRFAEAGDVPAWAQPRAVPVSPDWQAAWQETQKPQKPKGPRPVMARLETIHTAQRGLLATGDLDGASTCVKLSTDLAAQLIAMPRPSLLVLHHVADSDELWAEFLMALRHWAHARNLHQKNALRFSKWQPSSEYTRRRARHSSEQTAVCEKKLF
jgi:hypothetical protein